MDIHWKRQTTMLGTAIRLGVVLWLVTACMRPSEVAPLPEVKSPPPGCHEGAQREQVCRELGEARLFLVNGTTPLALDECAPNAYGAIVHWRRADGEPFDYRGVVRFDWGSPRRRLTPVELSPLQREWRSGQQSSDDVGRVFVPVGKPCGAPSDDRTWIELTLRGPSETACISGPWLRGSQKRWCTQSLTSASELYTIYDFGWLRGHETWRVAVAPTSVLIARGHARKTITDLATVAQLASQLNELWTLEPWLEEHCRDGGETVVEALSHTGWRSITRNCSDPAGVLRTLEALVPADRKLLEIQRD